MNIERKTKSQLIQEIRELRQQLAASRPVSEPPGDSAGETADANVSPDGMEIQTCHTGEQPVLDCIRDVIYTTDANGNITYISPSSEGLLGLTPLEIMGRKFLDFIHPEDHHRVMDNYRKILNGEDQLNEYRLINGSGDTLWVLISSKPLLNNDRILGSCGIVTDITHRKNAMDSIIQESLVNAEVARLSRIILSSDSIETISNEILGQVVRITGSELGFIAYRDPASENIIIPAVTTDGFPDGFVNRHEMNSGTFSGIGRWVVEHDQPLMENHAAQNPRYAGLPRGHAAIHRFLSIPAWISDQPSGWIVVANKPADYTRDDLTLLEQIASLYSIAVSQRLTEQSLKRSEERYRTTIDNLDDMVHVVDRNFNLILYNRKVAENASVYSGLEGSLMGCSLFDTFPFLSQDVREHYAKVLKTGRMNRTLDATHVKNSVVYTDAQRIPVRDGDGNVTRIITIIRDVTDYKRIENNLKDLANELENRVRQRTSELKAKNEALEQEIEQHRKTAHALDLSQELTKTLMNTPYIIMILLEKNGDIVTCNDIAAKSMGSTPEKLVGKNVAEIIGKDQFLQRKAYTKDLFQDNKIIQFRDQRDGRWFDTTALPVLNPDGTLHRVAVIARDITNQKRMDEEILKNQKLESIGVLAGGIAHDFNNYFTGILGYINMVRLNTGIPEDARKLLESAEKATLETKLLAQQLLTFSKGGAPVCRPTDLRDVIREAVAFSTRGSNVQHKLYIQDKPMPADVDTGQIRQVIHNLILNSIHAMTNGGHIDVRGSVRNLVPGNGMTLPSGAYNVIEVADTGCGIAAEHLSRIFDPYFTTKSSGSGLGLAASHSIVTNHNGVITVESEPGHGSVFTVYLPVTDRILPRKVNETAQRCRGTGRVLVMDDEPYVRDIIDVMLTELGYDVVLTSNGDEAVQAYKAAAADGQPVRAVILDLTIPGGRGGVETLQKLRDINPEIKAIVTSGYSNDAILANYEQYGFIDALTKPFNLTEVQQVMQDTLGSASSS